MSDERDLATGADTADVEPAGDADPDADPAEDDEEDEPAPRGGSGRLLVIIAAAVVLLLVGGAAGMLITLSQVDSDAPPEAGSVDVGFAQDMRVHHLQAVTMAGIERDRTTDPVMRGIAFDIESTQLAQLSEMSGWLTVWGQPSLPDPGAGYMAWMSGSGMNMDHGSGGGTGGSGGPVRQMPGMASTDEINKLRRLSGRELDVFFLQLMLRHHQGGLPMAEYGAAHAGTAYVRNLAQKIVSSQTKESQLMTTYLAQRGGKPLPQN